MMIKSIKQVAALGAIGVLGLASCQQNEELSIGGFGEAEQEVYLEQLDQVMDTEIEFVSYWEKLGGENQLGARSERGRRGWSDCAEVTRSGEGYPRTVTIDFGDGCEGPYGHTKSGKIVVTISDALWNAGATRTVTLENFSIDDKDISGSRTTTNQGQNADGNWVVSRSGSLTVTDAEGAILSRTYEGAKEWLAGFGTDTTSTKEYLKTGTGVITTPEGSTYSKTITEAIHVDHSCRYPLSGVVEMVGPEHTIQLNFGNGECDNLATITRDGESEEVDLDKIRKKRRRRLRD